MEQHAFYSIDALDVFSSLINSEMRRLTACLLSRCSTKAGEETHGFIYGKSGEKVETLSHNDVIHCLPMIVGRFCPQIDRLETICYLLLQFPCVLGGES